MLLAWRMQVAYNDQVHVRADMVCRQKVGRDLNHISA